MSSQIQPTDGFCFDNQASTLQTKPVVVYGSPSSGQNSPVNLLNYSAPMQKITSQVQSFPKKTNEFIQQAPNSQPTMIQQQLPQYVVKKEVNIIQDTAQLDSLKKKMQSINDQNQQLAKQINDLENKPPVIQEIIQFVEDTNKIDQLTDQLNLAEHQLQLANQKINWQDNQNNLLANEANDEKCKKQKAQQEVNALKAQEEANKDEIQKLKDAKENLLHLGKDQQDQIQSQNGQISNLNNNLASLIQKLEDANKKVNYLEGLAKELQELKVVYFKLESEKKPREDKITELEWQKQINTQDIEQKEKYINELLNKLKEQSQMIESQKQQLGKAQADFDQLTLKIKQLNFLVTDQEKTIAQLKQALDQANSKINELMTQNASLTNTVYAQENQIKQLQMTVNANNIQMKAMQEEIDYLSSHEERLAVLHKELEDEKALNLQKFKENDKLLAVISKLELQIKKANQPGVAYNTQSSNEFAQNCLGKEETLKRSRLAIAQADSLKNSQVGNAGIPSNAQQYQASSPVMSRLASPYVHQ